MTLIEEIAMVRQTLTLTEAQLADLKRNFSMLGDLNNLDIPDTKVNCVSILSELASLLEELGRNFAKCDQIAPAILTDLKAQTEACLREAHEFATEIISMKPLAQSTGVEKIGTLEATLIWMKEMLSNAAVIQPGSLPAENQATAEALDQASEQATAVNTGEPLAPVKPAESELKPADFLEIIEAKSASSANAPAEAKAEQPAAETEMPPKDKKTRKRSRESAASGSDKALQPTQRLPEPSSPAHEEKIRAPLIYQGIQKMTDAVDAVPPTQQPVEKAPPPPVPVEAPPPGASPAPPMVPEVPKEPAALVPEPTPPPPQPPPVPPSSPRESISEEILRETIRINKELLERIDELERQIRALSGQEHGEARALEARLQTKLEFFERKLQEVKLELSGELERRESTIKKQVEELTEKQEAVIQSALHPPRNERPETSESSEMPAPAQSSDGESPAEVSATPAASAIPAVSPAGVDAPLPPEFSAKPISEPARRKGSFLRIVFRLLKLFLIALVIFNILFFGVLFVLNRWKPSPKYIAQSRPAASSPKPDTSSLSTPYYDAFVASRPASLEKRSLKLLVIQLRTNPKAGVRANMATMLGRWKWKGIPDILLEVVAAENNPEVVREAVISFKAITGYDGNEDYDALSLWWERNKADVDAKLTDSA